MSARIIRDISKTFSCDFAKFAPEIETLQKIRHHDEYTYLHCVNVAKLSVALGKRLGLNEQMLLDLGWAALLHDIGKLHVPIDVLNKMHKFSPEELSIMQSHPLEALSAFAHTNSVTVDRLNRLSAAFEHHQRYDLKGYPHVQKKLTLHPFSRIVSITDTFDAMTTDRIYQRRVLPDVALKIMAQGFGNIFDPVVLQAFITAMGMYPVGSVVRLSNDELAVVVHYHEQSAIDRPEIIYVREQAERRIDLMAAENQNLKILRSEAAEDYDILVEDLMGQANHS